MVMVAGLAVSAGSGLAWASPDGSGSATSSAQPAKKVVKSITDLPVHTYTIEGKASEFLLSDAPFKAFVEQVKANVEADLATHDIQDATTLRAYEMLRMQIAALEGRWSEVPGYIERARALETKESSRLMLGQTMLAYVAARGASAGDAGKLPGAFAAALEKSVGALPWDKVAEDVKAARGRAQLITRDLVLGQVQATLDPVAQTNQGKLSSDMAHGLISLRMTLDHMLPLQPQVADVYGRIIERNEASVQREDVWTPRQVTLTEADKGTPVVVAIWDSGVDFGVFQTGNLFTNSKEVPGNNADDDNNGFVDDVHGIAFDLESNRVSAPLLDTSPLVNDKALVVRHTKGLMDVQANVQSKEADELRQYMATLGANDVNTFLEDLGLYGGYSHGTHVAGIAAAGNPFAQIMGVRITFDWKSIPQITPSIEDAQRSAQAARDTVAYMRAHGVRVVNMSWGGSVTGIESALEMKGVGKTPEERRAMAKQIFAIGRDALEDAMKSAPEILFVAAAGNSDNDNEFSEMIPSGLNVPNMITVGAIDFSGKPTDFTTFGRNVTLYANGFEVDSFVPGGQRMKFSGTSMAAPQVANLAAKLLALNPKLSTAQVVELMTQGATPLQGHEGRLVIDPKNSIERLRAQLAGGPG